MATESLERILAEHPFFKGLAEPYLQLLVGCASNVRFNAGELIFREGEEANQFYLIRHGKVALETSAPQRGPIIIQTLGEGEVLGWSWLVAPYRWRFDARAVELTRAIALDGMPSRQVRRRPRPWLRAHEALLPTSWSSGFRRRDCSFWMSTAACARRRGRR